MRRRELSPAEARVSAMALVRLLATGTSATLVKDRILIDAGSACGLETLLEVTVAACDLLRQVLAVYATEPETGLLAAIDSLSALLENEI